MDLTFQVPMQYFSLQHRTLLLSPVTSTPVCCFCFGYIRSFFLELFLHWSPVVYWAPPNLGSSPFGVLYFCLFILCMGLSVQDYWNGLPFPFCFIAKWFSYTHALYIYIMCVYIYIYIYTHTYILLFHLSLFFFFFISFGYTFNHVGLVPWPGIEHACPAVEVWSHNHWTARGVQYIFFSIVIYHRTLNIVLGPLQSELVNPFSVL